MYCKGVFYITFLWQNCIFLAGQLNRINSISGQLSVVICVFIFTNNNKIENELSCKKKITDENLLHECS